MKTLNTYINEWRASSDTVSSIEKQNIKFIFEPKITYNIKIFDHDWPQFKDYKDKVYMNGKKIFINNSGCTIDLFTKGRYEFYIEDIDNITNCRYMFWNCTDLVEVPLFNTFIVETMEAMFYHCISLKEVPLFNTSNVKNMYEMFGKCENLSDKTKQEWSKVYDFEHHIMKYENTKR